MAPGPKSVFVRKQSIKPFPRLLLLLILSATAMQADAANIYRYKDDSGRTVFNSSIPSQYVKNGYTILNERGEVIQVVAPAPTREELAKQEAERQALASAEEAKRKQLEADNLLLRLFRSPEEVAKKRDERIQQMEIQISGLQVTLNKMSETIQEREQVNENVRSQGREPSAEQLAELVEQISERDRLQDQLNRQESDKQEIVTGAVRDMQRLRELLNLTEQTEAE